MTPAQIALQRFQNQHINGKQFSSPADLVQWFGAIQAQDYGMSKWALGVRMPGTNDAMIEAAINNGEVIRTHVLRPTWHLVSPQDLNWMMDLTAANIKQIMGSNNRKLELDEKLFGKCNKIITKILKDCNYLTRKEIMAALQEKGIRTDDLRSSHIMLRSETDKVVCSGPRRGKEFTYALFEERVPTTKLTNEDALATLARKYFQSHGPATLQDFAWWSGLSMTKSRSAFALIKQELNSVSIKEDVFWFYEIKSKPVLSGKVYFLPAYDEFLIAYKTRHISLPAEQAAVTFTINGIFKPLMVSKAQVIGIWKPRSGAGLINEPQFFSKPTEELKRSAVRASNEFSSFHRPAK